MFCELADGQRIGFRLKKRDRDPFYLVCFRGPNRKRQERSTKATSQKKAQLAAVAIIRKAYDQAGCPFVSWQQAIDLLGRHTSAANLRPGTVEQYKLAINNLRKVFPHSEGPADITPAQAEDFKVRRAEAGKSNRTVAGNLTNLSIVYGRWFRDVCKIIDSDPFADIEPPKQDKPAPRIITADEEAAFREWLASRWDEWRLPLLFLDIKAAIGCRIGELAALPSANLKAGRAVFVAESTKGRKQRAPKLPAGLFAELQVVAGPVYAFERFADELRGIHDRRGLDRIAAKVKPFSPERFYRWLQSEAKTYFEKTGAKRFKLHNFRGTAMSKARTLGVPYDDAAVAFGCNPETMRKHYVAIDEQAVSDDVFDRLQGGEI